MTPEKTQLRTIMKNRLEALSADADEWASFSYAACMNALAHPAFKQANTLLLYAAMKDEPDASAIVEAALSAHKRVAFPVCGENRSMRAYAPLHPGAWEVGKYGIRTPRVEESLPIAPEDIDLILVPGLAFDRRGARLGRGAGYYDRYLEKTHAYRLGICLDFQLIDLLPLEQHDALMQAVATNTELVVL